MTTTALTLQSLVIDTPVGPLRLVANETALVAVLWPEEREGRVKFASEPEDSDREISDSEILNRAASQLHEYFSGERRSFDLPLDPQGTEFQQEVWQALREIPFAETSTYGEQAASIGRPRAFRAVGSANGRNPLSIVVPCHRIVGASGKLTGFAGGVDTKRWLLDHERTVADR